MAIREKQYHDELKLELQGITYSAALSNKDFQSSLEDTVVDASFPDPEQIVEDTRNMSQVVMPRKKRKLYEAMQVLVILIFLIRYLIFHLLFHRNGIC